MEVMASSINSVPHRMDDSTPPSPLRSGDDHLSTLIPELLIGVLSHVPSGSYLSLVHTSQFFRHFMRANGAHICNEAIQNVQAAFSKDAPHISSTLTGGWLVPTEPIFVTAETRFTQRLLSRCPRYRRYRFQTVLRAVSLPSGECCVRLTHIKKPVNPTSPPAQVIPMKIKLSQPGPQFLSFIETHGHALQIQYTTRCLGPIQLIRPGPPGQGAVMQEERAVSKRAWDRFLDQYYIQPFLESANATKRNVFNLDDLTGTPPRVGPGLIWYYGCQ